MSPAKHMYATSIILMSTCMAVGSDVVTQTYPVVAGSTLVITCPIDVTGLSSTNIVWDRTGRHGATISVNGKVESWADPGKFSTSNGSGKVVLHVEDMWVGDEGVYRCYKWPTSVSTTYHETSVVVLVNPRSLSLVGPNKHVTKDEGTTLQYECSVENSKPLPEMVWTMEDSNGQLRDISEFQKYVDTGSQDGISSRTSVLSIAATRDMYRGTIICTAESAVLIYSETKRKAVPDMNLMPLKPVISRPSPLIEGRSYTLTCKSHGSKPVSALVWSRNGVTLNTTYRSMQEFDNTFTVTSTLNIQASSRDHESQYQCDVINDVMLRQLRPPLKDILRLDVQFEPEITATTKVVEVIEGENAFFNLTVNANPFPESILWYRNGKELALGQGIRPVNVPGKSVGLHIGAANRSAIGRYHCQLKNAVGISNSTEIALHVQLQPQCHENHKQKYGVHLKSTVTLTCRVYANPNAVTFVWLNSAGQTISVPGRTTPTDRYHAYSSIFYTPNTTYDYTTFQCFANNSLGSSRQPCPIEVVAPGPSEAPRRCLVTNIASTSLTVRCESGFDGGSKQYFSLQQRVSGKGEQTTVTILSSGQPTALFSVDSLAESSTFTFRVCSSNSEFPDQTACTTDITGTTLAEPKPLQAPENSGASINAAASTNTLSNEMVYVIVALVVVVCVGGLVGTAVFVYRNKKKLNAVDIESAKKQATD